VWYGYRSIVSDTVTTPRRSAGDRHTKLADSGAPIRYPDPEARGVRGQAVRRQSREGLGGQTQQPAAIALEYEARAQEIRGRQFLHLGPLAKRVRE
jgi:hypothetical protein